MAASLRPDDFACAMREHWTRKLGNVASPAFTDLWRVMATTFNDAIEASAPSHEKRGLWRVLQPPTGSGKTQGARVYCAMQAIKNLSRVPEDKLGVLIVSREIAEADKLAEEINETVADMLGGSQAPKVALSRHSENASKVTLDDMRSATVLIITHAAYVKALDRLQHNLADRWDSFIAWDHGQRNLTIVDETISNLVESYQLNIETLKKVMAFIHESVRRQFPQQIVYLEKMLEVLRAIQTMADKETSPSDRVVWEKAKALSGEDWGGTSMGYDMGDLRAALSGIKGDLVSRVPGAEGLTSQHPIAALADHTLKSVEAIYSRWAWYARKGKDDTLNTSRLLLPDNFPGPVVLDATASQDVLWSLLGDKVTLPPIPAHTRNYANVTLHVSRVTGGLGKGAMGENGKRRLARLMGHLKERFAGQDRKTFMVVHKAIEHLVVGQEVPFGKLKVAHWGSIDGKNEWSDCDTAVIVGLSYRDRIWANNLFMAIKGLQDTAWLSRNAEVRNEMERRQLTVGIVQAINRIRCRRVIDEQGNCPKSEVFLFLPSNELGDSILSGIVTEMPGIVVTDWDFSLDGPSVALRRGSSHEGIVTLMTNKGPGEVPLKAIEREFGLSPEGAKKLRATLRDHTSPLAQRLSAIGVSLVTTGSTRWAKSYLIKRAA
jgi:hypothetical protein